MTWVGSRQQAFFATILAVLLLVFAVILWWVNTVASVLLIAASMFLCVMSCCQTVTSGDVEVSERGRRRRRMLTPIFDDEDALEIEFEDEFDDDLSDRIDASKIPSGLPVDIIEGMNPRVVGRLHEAGIDRLTDIIDTSPEEIARICEVDFLEAKVWIADASVIVIGGGVDDILSLSKSTPVGLLVKIEQAIESGKIVTPPDYQVTEETTKAWILAARDELVRLGMSGS